MTIATWNGGDGRFDTPEKWDTGSVPGAGDTAIIDGGAATVADESISATVVLGGTDPGATPALFLFDAALDTLTMPHDPPPSPLQPDDPTASPVRYGTLFVAGHGSIGTLDLGAFASPDSTGGLATTAPDDLTVSLGRTIGSPLPIVGQNLVMLPPGTAPPPVPFPTVPLGSVSSLDAGFDVREDSTLTVEGDEGSSFNVSDSTIEGGRVVIDAPLGGNGTITLTYGAVSASGVPDGGTLELGGGAGADTTVAMHTGTLQLDQPMAFLGQVDLVHMLALGPPPGLTPLTDDAIGLHVAPQRVDLMGLVADSFGFDDASHTLSLFNGDQLVDRLRFTPDVTSTDLKPSTIFLGLRASSYQLPAALQVVQQSDRVSVFGVGGTPVLSLDSSSPSPLPMRMA